MFNLNVNIKYFFNIFKEYKIVGLKILYLFWKFKTKLKYKPILISQFKEPKLKKIKNSFIWVINGPLIKSIVYYWI